MVTFGDVPNIALRAVIPGVCVYAFLPVFGWGPVTGGSGDKRPPISGDTDLQGGARDTMVNAAAGEEEREKRERGKRERFKRERKKERKKLQETTKKKQTQKHELTLREMQKNVNTSFGLMRRHSIQKPL